MTSGLRIGTPAVTTRGFKEALEPGFKDYQFQVIKNFPPLQTMESLLFGFLWAGWTLLSLSLISGWLFVENLFAQHLVHKTLLACLAWVVFSVLLWGRNRLGWRGHKAIRWTLAGLLMLAFTAAIAWFFALPAWLWARDRKSTRLNSSHYQQSRMPSSA